MKTIVLSALLLFAIACGSATKKETPPEIDSSLVKELDSTIKVAADTSARKDTMQAKKQPVKKKSSKQKVQKKKQAKHAVAAKKKL